MAEVVFVIKSIISACIAISQARKNKEYAKYDKLYNEMNIHYNKNPQLYENPKVKRMFKEEIDTHYKMIKSPEWLNYYKNSRLSESVKPIDIKISNPFKQKKIQEKKIGPKLDPIENFNLIGSTIPSYSQTAINFHKENMNYLFETQNERLNRMWTS